MAAASACPNALQAAAQTIEQTHGVFLPLEELMAAPVARPLLRVNDRYGCFSSFAARAPAPAV